MKIRAALFVAFLLVALEACAQSPLVIAWDVPIHKPTVGTCPTGTGGDPFYCDFQTYVLPWIDGVSIALDWAQSGIDTTTCVHLGTCTQTYSSLAFSNFDSNTLSQYYNATCGEAIRPGGHLCIVNIVVQHVSNNSPNSATPSYVFQQEWANTTSPAVSPGWQASTLYYTNSVILVGSTYWTETGAGLIGYCTSAAMQPNFTGISVIDNGCKWTNPSVNATPQDVTVCTNYAGTGFSGPGQYSVNSGYMPSVLATGFPAFWENPYMEAYNKFNQNVIAHYSGVSWNLAYIRVGVTLGGEVSTQCVTQIQALMSPVSNAQMKLIWTGTAANIYAYNAVQRLAQTSVGPWYLMAAINCANGVSGGPDCTWAQAEAAAALSQPGYSYGAQYLETSDATNITYGTSCTGANCCGSNWCNARNTAVGSAPFFELQACNISTAAGGTNGCLNNASNQAATLSQVFALATQHGVNAVEIYADDLLCAFDQNNYYNPITNSCTLTVSAGYQTAVQNLALGQPSGTSQLFGKAQIIGGGTGQSASLLQ